MKGANVRSRNRHQYSKQEIIGRTASAIGISALLLSAGVAPSYADSVVAPDTPVGTCIDAADEANLQQWVCFDSTLYVLKDDEGAASDEIFDVAPDGALDEVVPSDVPAPSSDLSVGEVEPLQVGFGTSIGRHLRVAPMAGGDYDDTWCENGSTCTTTTNAYGSKTKGNAAYGNQNGVTGSFDIILYTNLNGRQAQWKVVTIWDSGPALTFQSPTARCRQADFFAAIDCGNHASSDFYISSGRPKNTSSTIYGNRLNNAADYYTLYNANFTPSGQPIYAIGTLRGAKFNCPSSGNCRF